MATSGTGIPGGGGSHWLSWLQLLLAGRAFGERPAGAHFVEDILRQLEPGVALTDEAIGTWYASVDAADWGDNLASDRVGIRFLLSRQPGLPRRVQESVPLQRPRRVSHDLGRPKQQPDTLALVFNFSSLLPVAKNLELFREFAISQIKRLRRESSAPPD